MASPKRASCQQTLQVEVAQVKTVDAQSRLRRAFALIMRAASRAEPEPPSEESSESAPATDR
ncbi:MAG: hypothetical protein O2909_08870 [Chloroflexi bacterium]|nr:hypothetical protein [Chloroflexota bacterium]